MKNSLFDDKKISLIVDITCSYFGLSPIRVFENTREGECVRARQIIHYLIKIYTKKTLEKIGKISLLYGRKQAHDHSSVLYSNKKVKELMESDKSFLYDLQKIELSYLRTVEDLTPEQIETFNLLDFKHVLQLRIKSLREENEALTISNNTIRSSVTANISNKYLKRLLSMDSGIIDKFCETRLKPYLLLLNSRVTQQDLINRRSKINESV